MNKYLNQIHAAVDCSDAVANRVFKIMSKSNPDLKTVEPTVFKRQAKKAFKEIMLRREARKEALSELTSKPSKDKVTKPTKEKTRKVIKAKNLDAETARSIVEGMIELAQGQGLTILKKSAKLNSKQGYLQVTLKLS